jgi:hypothetical protein
MFDWFWTYFPRAPFEQSCIAQYKGPWVNKPHSGISTNKAFKDVVCLGGKRRIRCRFVFWP